MGQHNSMNEAESFSNATVGERLFVGCIRLKSSGLVCKALFRSPNFHAYFRIEHQLRVATADKRSQEHADRAWWGAFI